MSPLLLKALGCEVIELYSKPNGMFSRIAEPAAKNLGALENEVKKHSADIGFATDPDVDRLSIVSDEGKALGTEYTLLLSEKYVLSQKKGNIATNLSSSMASDVIAKENGVEIFRSRVGEINVAEAMKEHNCIIGGEGNGGVILPDLHFTRDAPLGMALILSYMATSGKTISELAAEIPKYYIYKTKLDLTGDTDFEKVSNNILNDFFDKKLDTQDGIKIIDPDFWIHIRKSGTEPIVRIIAESSCEEESKKLCEQIIKTYFE